MKALGNDKQTIKEQVKQVNTQVVVHNALPLEDQRAYLIGERYKEEKNNKLDQKSKLM